LLFSFSSFACPKEETRKRHPNQSWPYGLPLLLDEDGRTNGERKIPLARSRAPQRLPKRGFALFEAKPSLQSPGSIEEYPMRGINSGHPAFGGTRDTGGPFFGSFLWASKEMNRHNFIASFPGIPG
jgi:hypothetical protein